MSRHLFASACGSAGDSGWRNAGTILAQLAGVTVGGVDGVRKVLSPGEEPPVSRAPAEVPFARAFSLPRRGVLGFGLGALMALILRERNAAASGALLGANHTSISTVPMLRSVSDVRSIVAELLAAGFPELRSVPIRIEPYDSDPFYSFEARPAKAFASVERGGFLLRVNRAIFDLDLPQDIAKAVIAHELSHGVWYLARGSNAGLNGLAAYLFDRVSFEKATDLEATRRGYGPGLAAHRRWLAERFSANHLSERNGLYLTAEEIERASADPHDPLWRVWRTYFEPRSRDVHRGSAR